jgi:hypothetical protein
MLRHWSARPQHVSRDIDEPKVRLIEPRIRMLLDKATYSLQVISVPHVIMTYECHEFVLWYILKNALPTLLNVQGLVGLHERNSRFVQA